MLTIKPGFEWDVNMINTEMNQMILSQMQQKISEGDVTWIELAQKIQEIRTQNLEKTNFSIQRGKNLLGNV